MVRGSDGSLFCHLNYNKTTGAEAKPGEDIMVVQCKKGKLFITGEVFLLDIGLLMCAECQSLFLKTGIPICIIKSFINRLVWHI